jgi:calreticulin
LLYFCLSFLNPLSVLNFVSHSMKIVAFVLLGLLAFASATVHFKETFDDAGWESRWVKSKNKEAEGTQGTWDISHGKFYADAEADKGLHTTQDARFYQISAEFPKFSNEGKDLIVQYSVKHEQRIDCGGAYVKLLPSGLNQENFNGDSTYNIMFGPDICGSSTKKTHLIFTYKGKNYLINKSINCETDEFTHLYTLHLKPDNTYSVLIDSKEVASGSLETDWDMLPPKEIKDPNAKKPENWDDRRKIPDPEDKKPEGYDDIPAEIADPNAKKPDDWDDELDGEWEAPMIDNPDFKGEWQPKLIDNANYQGEWIHPMIANPDYHEDKGLYVFKDNKFIGIEVWQVKAGTIFDNFLVTDDMAEAERLAELTKRTQEGEKKMKEKDDEDRRQREEAERAAHPEHEDEEEEETAHKDEL